MPHPNPAAWRSLLVFMACLASLMTEGCADGSGVAPDQAQDPNQQEASDFRYSCELTFSMDALASTYEEILLQTVYEKSLGTFLVAGDKAHCRSEVAPIASGEQDHVNNNADDPDANKRTLTIVLDDPHGISLPAELANCTFLATREPGVDDFQLSATFYQLVGEAGHDPLDSLPSVSSLHCRNYDPPDGSTTTTLPACSPADCLPDGICKDGACTRASTGRLGVYLDGAASPVEVLQIQIDYGDSGAMFSRGDGPRACELNVELQGVLHADCNFQDEGGGCEVYSPFHPGEIGMGWIASQPLEAPLLLATCDIVAEDLEAAVAAMRIELHEAGAGSPSGSGNFEPVAVELSLKLEPN